MTDEYARYSPAIRKKDTLTEEILDEFIVYDTVTNQAHRLNPTLSWIWKHSDGKTSVQNLAERIEADLQVTDGIEIVLDGLKQLQENDLLEPMPSGNGLLNGGAHMNRREAMAFSAVAWPAMFSIIAPTVSDTRSRPGRGEEIREQVRERIRERLRERFGNRP